MVNVFDDGLVHAYGNGINHSGAYDNDYVFFCDLCVRDDDFFDDDGDFFDVLLLLLLQGLGGGVIAITGKGVVSFLIIAISLSLASLVQPLARMNDLKYFSASLMKSSFSVRKYVQLCSTSLCLSF